MKPLVSFPQCLDCIREMARTASEMAAGPDEALVRLAPAPLGPGPFLNEAHKQGLTSPEVANLVMREIAKDHRALKDPYAEFKEKGNGRGPADIHEQVAQYEVLRTLTGSLSFAVLSNSLDSFKKPDEALSVNSICEQAQKRPCAFHRDDSAVIQTAPWPKKPKLMLYLTDNAGEMYFDLPLYDYLRTRAQRLVLVVKGGPGPE